MSDLHCEAEPLNVSRRILELEDTITRLVNFLTYEYHNRRRVAHYGDSDVTDKLNKILSGAAV